MDLLDEARHTAQRLERIRGLRFAGIPPAVRAGEAARKEAASKRVEAALPVSTLVARGRAWADLGLGGGDAPRRLLEALADDLRGIGFDAVGRRVLVDPSLLPAEDLAPKEGEDSTSSLLLATGVRPDEPALAHVLMHALERGRTGGDPIAGTTDATLAASAWAEGEANVVAVLYLFDGLGIQSEVIERALDPGQLLGGTLVPASLDLLPGVEGLLLDFVFREGYAQAAGSYKRGGFRALDRGAAGRRTTRDVLHPDRAPLVPVQIPEPPAPKGWVLADRDALGEEGIVVLVSSLTGKDNLGLMAGDGWAGDALFRFEPEGLPAGRDGLTVWVSRWVSADEAAEFEYGIERSLTGRFPGTTLESPASGERRMVAAGRVFSLSKTGQQVTLQISSEAAGGPAGQEAPKRSPARRKSNRSK
jgi:hypothetical protein